MIDVTAENFDVEVTGQLRTVLVDFWAPWCNPCRLIAPVLEEIEATYPDKVHVVKINADENVDLARQFEIQGIPTVLVYRHGEELARFTGVGPKQEMIDVLTSYFS